MMSEFSIIMKRPLKSEEAIAAMKTVERIFILEHTQDHLVYLWPVHRLFTSTVPLRPNDPADREFLRTGEFLSYGGYYYNVSDYFRRNNLPEDQFFAFYLGVFEDIYGARNALQYLKALL